MTIMSEGESDVLKRELAKALSALSSKEAEIHRLQQLLEETQAEAQTMEMEKNQEISEQRERIAQLMFEINQYPVVTMQSQTPYSRKILEPSMQRQESQSDTANGIDDHLPPMSQQLVDLSQPKTPLHEDPTAGLVEVDHGLQAALSLMDRLRAVVASEIAKASQYREMKDNGMHHDADVEGERAEWKRKEDELQCALQTLQAELREKEELMDRMTCADEANLRQKLHEAEQRAEKWRQAADSAMSNVTAASEAEQRFVQAEGVVAELREQIAAMQPLKKRSEELEELLAVKDREIDFLRSQQAEQQFVQAEGVVAELREQIAAMQPLKKRSEELEELLAVKDREIDFLRSQQKPAEANDSDVSLLSDKLLQAEQDVAVLREHLTRAEQELQVVAVLKEQLEGAEQKLQKVAELEGRLLEVQEENARLQGELTHMMQEAAPLRQQVARLEQEAAAAKEAAEKESLTAQSLKESLTAASQQLAAHEAKVVETHKELEAMEDRLTAANQELRVMAELREKVACADRELRAMEELKEKVAFADQELSRMSEIESRMLAAEEWAKRAEAELAAAQQERLRAAKMEEAAAKLEQEVLEEREKASRAEQEVQRMATNLRNAEEELQGRLAAAEEAAEASKREAGKLKEMHAVADLRIKAIEVERGALKQEYADLKDKFNDQCKLAREAEAAVALLTRDLEAVQRQNQLLQQQSASHDKGEAAPTRPLPLPHSVPPAAAASPDATRRARDERPSEGSAKRMRIPPQVALSGFKEAREKKEMTRIIEGLGGVVVKMGVDTFDDSCTHIVIPTPEARTIKTVSAVLSEKWVVTKQWLLHSQERKAWVDERPYGYQIAHSGIKDRTLAVTPGFNQLGGAERMKQVLTLIANGKGRLVNNPDAAEIVLHSPEESVPSIASKVFSGTWEAFIAWIFPTDWRPEVYTHPK